jgi:hypothetical protein
LSEIIKISCGSQHDSIYFLCSRMTQDCLQPVMRLMKLGILMKAS